MTSETILKVENLKTHFFTEEGVVHFCVPNAPGVLPRTSTHAFNNAAWPYIRHIAERGLDQALEDMPGLERGVALRNGEIVNEVLAAAYEARV